jgi:hypothetical protein
VRKTLGMYGLLLAMVFFLGSCAHMDSNGTSEETLNAAVKQVWEAKVKGEWGVVYDASVREYKERVKREDFLKNARLNVKEYTIQGVELLEPGKRAVSVAIYKVIQSGFEFQITGKDEWLWQDGAWRLNLVPSLGAPMKQGILPREFCARRWDSIIRVS